MRYTYITLRLMKINQDVSKTHSDNFNHLEVKFACGLNSMERSRPSLQCHGRLYEFFHKIVEISNNGNIGITGFAI